MDNRAMHSQLYVNSNPNALVCGQLAWVRHWMTMTQSSTSIFVILGYAKLLHNVLHKNPTELIDPSHSFQVHNTVASI